MNVARFSRQVILEPDETGGYVVSCPSLPGCHSQGETIDDALDNIGEAIELYFEVLAMDDQLFESENPNKWVSSNDAFASWEIIFSLTRHNYQLLYEFADKVINIGQQLEIFDILEIPAPNPFKKSNELTYREHIISNASQSGYIRIFNHGPGVAPVYVSGKLQVVSTISYFDKTDMIIQESIDDMGLLQKNLHPARWEKIKYSGLPRVMPLCIEGDRIKIDELSDSPKNIRFRIELFTDIWFPKVEDPYGISPAYDHEDMIDNRALALRHTPRLNQFIQGVRVVAESYGATWKLRLEDMGYEYPRLGMYLPMLTDNGIVLDE